MKPIRMLSAIAAAATLTACALELPYERPDAPVVAAFPQATPAPADPQTATADIGWRDFFSDVRLQRLIAIALDNNRDLRVAVLNIEAARALPHPALRVAAWGRCQRFRNGAGPAGRAHGSRSAQHHAHLQRQPGHHRL